VGPLALIESTRRLLRAGGPDPGLGRADPRGAVALGTGSGRPLLPHGPAIHREMQLWVEAGVPAEVALRIATSGNARLLGAGDRIGAVRQGLEATLVVVNGNPLRDIAATEQISMVVFRGERVGRAALFDDDK
jgi:imidazolonepropionase-like amidohydrolase